MSEENKQETFKVTDRRGQVKEEVRPQSKENNPASKEQKHQTPPRSKGEGIDFSSFVLSLSSSALMQMGLIPDPVTQKSQKNLGLARQQIDIIEMLAEKTQGNLNPEEARLVEQALYELRVRYVELTKT